MSDNFYTTQNYIPQSYSQGGDYDFINTVRATGTQRQQLKKIAKEFEAILVSKMLTQMDKTVDRENSMFGESKYMDNINIKELNEYDRHIEHSEIYENNLNNRAMDKPLSVDDEVVRKILTEELKKAIQELPETQKRRLEKYYFRNMTFEEIAQEENCTKMAVKFSVDIAIEKISKKLKF